ncbi:MAG: pyridoxamine 5'-phosphate oxidase family protein [Candidatus Riflebacteria bacterium]|nr:pyridoxamine 5'-phosphate oxidase family protein [Candidatus Riflebacteria bacterium]
MITKKLLEVMEKEGVVSIVSWAENDAHVVNTWNSYLVLTGENRILIPAYAMRKTEKNTIKNPRVKVTLGSKEVMGHRSMGTGFLLTGEAKFLSEGSEFDMMKAKFSFLTRVLEISVASVTQTL